MKRSKSVNVLICCKVWVHVLVDLSAIDEQISGCTKPVYCHPIHAVASYLYFLSYVLHVCVCVLTCTRDGSDTSLSTREKPSGSSSVTVTLMAALLLLAA